MIKFKMCSESAVQAELPASPSPQLPPPGLLVGHLGVLKPAERHTVCWTQGFSRFLMQLSIISKWVGLL